MSAPAALDGTERRILVVGSGGAGKSWLTTRLAAITGLPAVHLDIHFWNPGWKETPEPAWSETVARLTREARWVMDGNYSGTLRARIEAADAVIFLDVPRRRCLARIFGRMIRWRGRSRPDLAPGCPEGFDLEFLRWVWDFPKRSRPAVIAEMERAPARVKRITLRSEREVGAFLRACGATTRRDGAPGPA
ncbi:MAG: hypothetical protein ACM3JJ_04345 [Hyphomicrobiales bacterium]